MYFAIYYAYRSCYGRPLCVQTVGIACQVVHGTHYKFGTSRDAREKAFGIAYREVQFYWVSN